MPVPITKSKNEPDPHLMHTEIYQFTPDDYLTSEHFKSQAPLYISEKLHRSLFSH